MGDNQNDEPYNGAVFGYSPYDMDASECRYWAIDHISDDLDDDVDDDYDDDGDYDCCDDAEDYGEDDADDNAEND